MYFLSGDAVKHPRIIDPKLEVGQLRRPPQRESVARTYRRVIFLLMNRVPSLALSAAGSWLNCLFASGVILTLRFGTN